MITIAAGSLTRLLNQTKPHMAKSGEAEAVQVIVFEHADGRLYAVATNRYTLAVARAQAKGDDGAWTAIVDREQVPELMAAARLLDGHTITVERAERQLILSGASGTRVAIDLQDGKPPLDWRKVAAPVLSRKSAAAPMTLAPQFFGAWKSLPSPVQMWSSGQDKAALVLAADFLGLQMPIRSTSHEGEGLGRELDTWVTSMISEAAVAA